MPIYSLGEKMPQLPSVGSYWVAPDAHVIGNVIIGENVGIWCGNEVFRRGGNAGIMKSESGVGRELG